ncbi:uncharacterized protein LOC114329905 [Diabrotica virgifera virgifera]|uniref:Uncharacterized protein n=2 Tax=Diabrotica virgifera virgifera TaxID=50390 RepID=A0ABM5JTH1_DIAVI|nr:uncharacterized protein LOC114329905 [Diabrotica virgifera virgifera]
MLSYMLPVDEKPPTGPKGHLQLSLGGGDHVANGRTSTPISKETSISSFASDLTTATASHSSMTPTSTSEKGKPKLMINGKHPTLKRVSFGSSKGSMVETLIFETPVQEEPEPSPIPENCSPFPADHDQTEAEREKVKVKFFQQSKPLEVDLPNEPIFPETNFLMASPVTISETNHVVYNRTESTDSGWDNPFRPGGDLSREADEIVELIKGGKPITPTPGQQPPHIPSSESTEHTPLTNSIQEPITESPKKAVPLQSAATPKSANGTTPKNNSSPPGTVEVQRVTVKPDGDGSQVEHVTIKKKPKCGCCVIQ